MANNGSCVECGTETTGSRCGPCQRRHNDRLKAEHDLMVRAMFRATEGRTLGRSTTAMSRGPAPAAGESAANEV